MSNMEPPVTGSLEGNEATQYDGPDTIGTTGGSDFERDPFSDLDNDGDGDPEVDAPVFTWEEIQAREQGRHEVQAEAVAEGIAEREAAEAEAAARAEAAANGEPYYLGSDEVDGEPVDLYLMPDGATYMVNEDDEVVAVAFPEDPVYVGQVYTDDGAQEVFELYNGEQVVVADGEFVGTLDEVDHTTFTVGGPMATAMGLPADGEAFEAYTVPMGPPSYDTQIVNAETGEVVYELDTGHSAVPGLVGVDDDVAFYDPPGADYTMVVDDGEVVNIVPNPEEPEWSFLGIVEYYDDGTVSVDLAIVEVDVDLIGPEKGISASVDLVFIEVGAGVEWDSDGNWSFEADAAVDLGFAEAGGGIDVEWEDGEFSADLDGYVEMQLGLATLKGEGSLGIDVGPDGVEVTGEGELTLNAFGAYVGVAGEASVAVGPGGFEMAGEAGFVGGHDWVGDFGLHVGGDFRTDGTADGTGAGVELGGSIETPDSGPLAGPGMDSMEIGVRADTDDGVETYGEYEYTDRPDRESQLDLGWHDDMGVGDEIDTPDETATDEGDGDRRGDLDDETRMREHRLHSDDETSRPVDQPGRVPEGTSRFSRDVSGDHPTREQSSTTDPFDDVVTAIDRTTTSTTAAFVDTPTGDDPAVVFEPNDEPLLDQRRAPATEPEATHVADQPVQQSVRHDTDRLADPITDNPPAPTDPEPSADQPSRAVIGATQERARTGHAEEPVDPEPAERAQRDTPSAEAADVIGDPITQAPAAAPAPAPEPEPVAEQPARAEAAEPVAPAAAPAPAPDPTPEPAPVPEPMPDPLPEPQIEIEVETPAPPPGPEPMPIDEPTDDLLD